jgi:hypothetical protein
LSLVGRGAALVLRPLGEVLVAVAWESRSRRRARMGWSESVVSS